jgi:CRISPR-associated endonuclease/helicase Cas3
MLADWIGSDATSFPYDCGENSKRIDFARAKAVDVVRQLGLDPRPLRDEMRARALSFAFAFGVPQPRPIQSAAIEPSANLIVIESETGSGKTEAALWRFANLLQQGAVDGLYFALPTRVAATQIFERVRHFRDRVFPGPAKPAVVLAVPGQIRVDAAEWRLLPDFIVQWNDDPQTEADRLARWAAEHPKRFLAAPIAIGTIDQALLATLSVRHAHLRGTALLRQLLVVDEVHASDRYGEALLTTLLRDHLAAGGHALLVSATLGSASRARLLQTAAPSLQDAVRVP